MLRQEERRKHEIVFALFPSLSQSGYRDQETITHVTFRHGGVCLFNFGADMGDRGGLFEPLN